MKCVDKKKQHASINFYIDNWVKTLQRIEIKYLKGQVLLEYFISLSVGGKCREYLEGLDPDLEKKWSIVCKNEMRHFIFAWTKMCIESIAIIS